MEVIGTVELHYDTDVEIIEELFETLKDKGYFLAADNSFNSNYYQIIKVEN